MLRRYLRNRCALVVLLGLALVHATPTGVVLCASEDGLRFEFSCDCGTLAGDACACGSLDCEGALAISGSSCACSDHAIELAGARGVDHPPPSVQEATSALSIVDRFLGSEFAYLRNYSERNWALPPPVSANCSVVLLI